MDQTIRYKRCGPQEAAGLARISHQCLGPGWSHEQLAADLADRKRTWCLLAAGPDDTPVGFALFWRVLDQAELIDLAVLPAFRRRGIGRALLCRLIEQLHQQGVQTLLLDVRQSNTAAQALYRQLGFEAVGQRPSYYPDNGEAALLMRLKLVAGTGGDGGHSVDKNFESTLY